MVKHYTSGGVTETRVIRKPVAGTVKVYLDAIQKSIVSDALAVWFRTRLDRRGEGRGV